MAETFPVGTLIKHNLYDGAHRVGLIYRIDDMSPMSIAWVFWQINIASHAVSYKNQAYTEPVLMADIVAGDDEHGKRAFNLLALPVTEAVGVC